MTERVFYESGNVRIEVTHDSGVWMWFKGVDNGEWYGMPCEYRGIHWSLDECLLDATAECLEGDAEFVVSRDQRTEVRS